MVAIVAFSILFAASIFNATEANAQPTIELKFHKDIGYSSFGNDAQGNWTARVTVSADTTRVEFYLDDTLQRNDTEAPFSWPYNTDSYPNGLHTIKAIAYDQNENAATAEAQQNFVPFPADFMTDTIAIAAVAIAVAAVIAVIKIKRTNRKAARP